jgi:proline racemase
MTSAMRVSTVDYHTAGEPFRIVVSGGPEIEGATVLDPRDPLGTGFLLR